MTKSLYIFTCLIFALSFWNVSILMNSISSDVILFLFLAWIASGIFFFNYRKRKKALNDFKYKKTIYYIFLGVFISMFSAYYFGKQSFSITFIGQRGIFAFMFLPVILFVQPTEKDIIKALKWISIITIIVWILVHINPGWVKLEQDFLEQFDLKRKGLTSKLEFYVYGVEFVVLYLYFQINEYLKMFSWRVFIEVLILFLFIILYQNRSMILGTAPIFFYSLLKFKSRYKTFIIIPLSLILAAALIYTSDILMTLISNSKQELNASDYNRWKSLFYFFYEYPQSWFCYIFGNGHPSGGKSPLGNLMWANFTKGIYTSDLGMVGMWVDYGLIPLIAIYSIIVNILKHKYFPLYLKFISLHILLVPTIFGFWSNPGISFFVLIFYLHAYYTEQNKNSIQYAGNNSGELQTGSKDNNFYKRRVIQSADTAFDSDSQ
jgi:hypothetical protein